MTTENLTESEKEELTQAYAVYRPRGRARLAYVEPERSFLEDEARGWMHRAACRGYDTDIFVPNDDDSMVVKRQKSKLAKSICEGCPVQEPCLEWGMMLSPSGKPTIGVFGNTTGRERGRIANGTGSKRVA